MIRRSSRRLLNLLHAFVGLLSLATAAQSFAAAAAPTGDEAAIRKVLTVQSEAWNRGDIDSFMTGYWNDPALRFASGDSVTMGWQPTLDHYREHYADRAAMGKLSFADLNVEVVSADAAIVFGRWSLARDTDRPHGLFTLVFRKFADGWKITRDHTSAAAP